MATQPATIPVVAIDIEATWAFAEKIATSKFIKPAIRGDVPTVFHMLCIGEELGLKWTHATRGIYLGEKGGVGMAGEMIEALLLSKGFGVEFNPQTEPVIGCSCTITRPDAGAKPVTRTFTMNDAAAIKTTWNADAKKWWTLADQFNYLNYPSQMVQWRSLANCARACAADVMGGIYLPEELEESSGASAPANEPTSGSAAASAEDEFVVGEKEAPFEEAATETAAAPEAVPETAPDPPKAAAAPVIEMPKPKAAPAAAPEIDYRLHLAVTEQGKSRPTLTPCGAEVPQKNVDAARLRARAVAEAKKMPCVVLKFVDGNLVEGPDGIVVVCNPSSISTTTAPDPRQATAPKPPAATQAAPPQPTEGQAAMTFEVMIDKVLKLIGGNPKDGNSLLARYFRAFLNEKTVPKDRARLTPPLQKLVEVVDQRIANLKADPESLANELAGRPAKTALDGEFALMGWPAGLCALARKVMVAAGQSEQEFAEWLQLPIVANFSIASMEPDALAILFPLYLLVRGRAFEVLDFAIANQRGILQTLQDMVTGAGHPLEAWTVDFAEKVLSAIQQVSKEESQPKAAAPESFDLLDVGLPFGE